ncbi:MAG: hypothetical protein FJX75_10840 [Armatimonadetes bacterium]|nr:hypothetical protein [Armatimonadota bacterium]
MFSVATACAARSTAASREAALEISTSVRPPRAGAVKVRELSSARLADASEATIRAATAELQE